MAMKLDYVFTRVATRLAHYREQYVVKILSRSRILNRAVIESMRF